MRDILFKAKRIDNGEWVEGYLVRFCDRYGGLGFEIIAEAGIYYDGSPNYIYADVVAEAVMLDKNGQKIWENDIVEFEDVGEEGYEYKEGFDFTNRARVEFAEGRWSLTDFAEENSGVIDEMYDHAEFMELWNYCEVIGNIFDNPKLLKGGGAE